LIGGPEPLGLQAPRRLSTSALWLILSSWGVH